MGVLACFWKAGNPSALTGPVPARFAGPMTDPAKIAAALIADTFACPAAILVAFDDDPELVTLRSDIAHLATLRRLGCVVDGQVTRLGDLVADVLRKAHGVQAWKHWGGG